MTVPPDADATPASEPQYDVLVARGVWTPLRDGVRLASDVYLPARGFDRAQGTHPALLIRTPYDKNASAATGTYYAKRGYVLVTQDVRGRYASEGEFFAFADEAEDGYDTVQWVAEQPWCNGKVGTLGASYCAAVQSALACLAPPALAAMVVQFGPSSYYDSSMRHNGVLELRFLVYAFSMAATSREAAANPGLRRVLSEAAAHAWDYIRSGPIREGSTPLHLVPSYEKWAIDILTHAAYDDFWRSPGFGPKPHYDAHADVPTLYVGGWYDTYTRSTVENFQALAGRQQTAVHALIGPWTHGGVGVGEAGDATFRPAGDVNFETVRLRWFDQWLKNMDRGLTEQDPVTYFMMGAGTPPTDTPGKIAKGGEWRAACQWPPPEARETPVFLRGGGILDPSPPADGEQASTGYAFDPRDPVPTIGGNLSAMPLPAGMFDQRNDPRFPESGGNGLPLATRRDVLTFVSAPYEEDLELAGPVVVQLYVSTDGPDTDFTAKLLELCPPSPAHPGGAALNLTDGIARLRFRNGYEQEELGEPGKVYRLRFELYPTACRIRKGHRLRLDVSSSNYPRFELNPNTGGTLGEERRLRTAQNTVHHSPQQPSSLLLHVLAGKV